MSPNIAAKCFAVVLSLVFCTSAIGQKPAESDTKAKVINEKKPAAKSKSKAKNTKKKGVEDAKAKSSESHEFLRVRKNKAGKSLALETAIARYERTAKDGKKQQVDLIGVVHIGEKEYYEKLNKVFEQYDALLYELVAPEGTRVPKGGRKGEVTNPLAALQNGMKSMLDLEFQLDHIDYTKNNFVHADMSPSEFAESMTKNNESFMQMFMKMLGHSLAMQGNGDTPSDAQLLAALFSSDRAMRLREIFATQFQNVEMTMMVFDGEDGSTIINHRNKKAMTVMERELAAGKTKLGIFYGAGHLADMHELLTNKYGMRKQSEDWLLAWKLDRNLESVEDTASEEEDAGTEAVDSESEEEPVDQASAEATATDK